MLGKFNSQRCCFVGMCGHSLHPAAAMVTAWSPVKTSLFSVPGSSGVWP